MVDRDNPAPAAFWNPELCGAAAKNPGFTGFMCGAVLKMQYGFNAYAVQYR
jgi:hypothetical protein